MTALRLLPALALVLCLAPGCFGAEEEFEGDEAGECSDDADNDQDGLFDCDDEDCEGSDECDDPESNAGDDTDA
jgi:hypothetical protein